MATIDEDLGQFERDIRQLKIEYDQYFGGGRKRPPTEIEWRLDILVKRYAERGGELKFAQRFRFNNLSQTYAKYKDVFRKKIAQKEEGKIQRHFGAAAKEIEAARAKKEAEDHAAAVVGGNQCLVQARFHRSRNVRAEWLDQAYHAAWLPGPQAVGGGSAV